MLPALLLLLLLLLDIADDDGMVAQSSELAFTAACWAPLYGA
jgi:hypothetical protein